MHYIIKSGNTVVETPHSRTYEGSLHHTYVTYLPYLIENAVSPQMSHACAVTERTQSCFSFQSVVLNNALYITAERCFRSRNCEHDLKSNVPKDVQRASVFKGFVRRVRILHYLTNAESKPSTNARVVISGTAGSAIRK